MTFPIMTTHNIALDMTLQLLTRLQHVNMAIVYSNGGQTLYVLQIFKKDGCNPHFLVGLIDFIHCISLSGTTSRTEEESRKGFGLINGESVLNVDFKNLQ